MNINTVLDLDNPIQILGADLKPLVAKTLALLQLPGAPVIAYIGPPGSGKTHVAKALAIQYALWQRGNGYPDTQAQYIVLDPETTKSGIIGGKEIQNGSLIGVQAAIAQAMTQGNIIVVDEIGHAPESVPPTMNTIGDQDSVTYAGGFTIRAHENFRIIVCSNRASKDALNSPFAPSFATRPIAFYVGYPSIETEVTIAKKIVMKDLYGNVSDASAKRLNETLPDSVIRYIGYLARVLRDGGPKSDKQEDEAKRAKIADLVPVSARNMANVLLILSILPRDSKVDILPEWSTGNQEPHRRMLIERIFWADNKRQVNSTDLSHARVLEFLKFVSQVGKENFIDAVLSGVAFHMDIAGVPAQSMLRWREMAMSTVI